MNEINFGSAIVLPPCCFRKLIGEEFKGNNWNAKWEKSKNPEPKTRMFLNRGDLTLNCFIDYAVKRTGWCSVLVLSIPTIVEDTVREICGLMDMFGAGRPLVLRLGIVTSMSKDDVISMFQKVSRKDYGSRMTIKQHKNLGISAIAVNNAKASVVMHGEFAQRRTSGIYGVTVSTFPQVHKEITDYLCMMLGWKGYNS